MLDLVAGPFDSPTARIPAARSVEPRRTHEPSRVGRFRVEGRLGRGATADVFLARDGVLGRRVALKLPFISGSIDPEIVAIRLREEGSVLAALDHPGCITTYEFGVEIEQPYLALQYVDGPDLRRFVDPRRTRVRTLLELAAQAARALHAVHERGFVHRDVKPENLLIRVGTKPRALLIDFGLATPIVERSRGPLSRRAKYLVGTRGYAAPEQDQGAPPQPSADQYGLCASLHDVLLGRPPRTSDERSRIGIHDARLAQNSAMRALRIGLNPDPQARHPNMAALADNLERAAQRTRCTVEELRNIVGGPA